MPEREIDSDLIDEAVLAPRGSAREEGWRAWKSFDWGAMDRLHAKEFISDPVGTTKSVALTPEGCRRCEEAYYRLFRQAG